MPEASVPDDGRGELEHLLQQLRHKLLDLTGRSKLLNFHHNTSNCLRAVDELPDLQAASRRQETLFQSGSATLRNVTSKSTTPVTRVCHALGPCPRNWNDHPPRNGPGASALSVKYELVDTADIREPKHDDDYIQTLHYPESLAALLRKLQSDARTAIEESGVNMLYLVFGFLDWREPAKKDKACLAP
jgi:hypothetical protein